MTDGRVTVIGGGLTGLETAEYLYNHNMASEVRIVDMLSSLEQECTRLSLWIS
uniref:NAD-binding protein n=1 Tax=Enterocloster clostridioformis TaxID=1531 RepID=UPI003FA40A2F